MRGNALGIGDPAVLEWFKKHKFIDEHSEPTMDLYWQAVKDEVLHVEYVIKVDNSRPYFVLEAASVTYGQIKARASISMMEHAIALGLCTDGPLILAPVTHRIRSNRYQVESR